MPRLPSLSLILLLALAAAVPACGKSKKPAEQAEEGDESARVCESNDDCEAGWVCLDGECANSASGAIYTDPGNAVTPDKVRGEVERIQQQAQERADKILEDL